MREKDNQEGPSRGGSWLQQKLTLANLRSKEIVGRVSDSFQGIGRRENQAQRPQGQETTEITHRTGQVDNSRAPEAQPAVPILTHNWYQMRAATSSLAAAAPLGTVSLSLL